MSEITITPLAPLTQKSATDMVFDTLYEAVISLQLPPGTRVSEAEIAQQLDVSRQPVRDAFFRLSKLGFLLIRPQRATLISKISPKAVLNAAFIRTAIECECLREAARQMTPEAAARLRASLDRQEAALEESDRAVFHALDDAFHLLISEIAGHPHAWELIQEQKAEMDRVRFLTLSGKRQRQVHAEHQGIVDALTRGDTASAEAQLRNHLADIRHVLARVRAEHGDYFEPVD